MKSLDLFLISVLVLLTACSSDEPVPDAPQQLNAGYQKIEIPHPTSGTMWLGVWYPTSESETAYTYNMASTGFNVKGSVASNASTAKGNWPLIVFSHGFSGGGIGSVEICEALAKAGYVVAAPDHSDAVMAVRVEGPATGTIGDALRYLSDHPFGDGTDYEYRIGEANAVVTAMVQRSEYNLSDKLILGGHSMGGWTVMKAMEAGIDPDAMFFLSMGELNWLFTGARYFEAPFFQTLVFPTAYFHGEDEYSEAVDAGRGDAYAAYCYEHSPSPSYGLVVADGNHFTYNSRSLAPGSGGTAAQFEAINSRLIQFLDKHVQGKDVSVSLAPGDVSK